MILPPTSLFRAFALVAVLLGSAVQPVPGQTPDPPRRPFPAQVAPPLLPESADREFIQRGPLLDGPVSRTEYRLGPGDMIVVALFGEADGVFPLQVQPEGSIVVPGIGIMNVLGLNLQEAEQRLDSLVRRYFRNVRTGLSLAAVRTFKVFVVGDVESPGVRSATAATRVSEIVGELTARRDSPTLMRNVVLRRAGGDSLLVDLARFSQMGDLRENPLLREGDVVLVPSADRTVRVAGHVHYPGDYQYRPDETLAELLTVANGGAAFPAGAADPVRLVRRDAHGGQQLMEFTVAEAMGHAGGSVRLEAFDAVFVAEAIDYRRQPSVRISGQVRRPGTYPIRPDTTTVGELIELAGGFTSRAALLQTTLRRQPGLWRTALQQAESLPVDLMSEADREVMRVRLQSDASLLSVSFHELFAAGRDARALTLQAGDSIDVPEHRHEVLVLGAVGRPGIIQFTHGAYASDYIQLAGGATRQANLRRAVVIRSPSGSRARLSDAAMLQPGDVVIVPARPEVNWSQRIQIVTSVAAALTSLALTAVTLF